MHFMIDVLEESAAKAKVAKTAEATKILTEGLRGGIHARHRLEEAISTSDFHTSLLDGFKLASVELMAQATREWEPLAVRTTVPDFHTVKARDFFGGLKLQRVPEGTEYPLGSLEQLEISLQAEKFGSGYKFTWEMWKNREFSGLLDIPQLFADAAIESENSNVFGLLLNGTDGSLNGTFFKGDAAGTGALTRENLQAAWSKQALRKRIDGKSAADLSDYYLVVHPSAVLEAEALVNTAEVVVKESKTEYKTPNTLRGRLKVMAPRTLADLGMKPEQWFLLPGAKSKNPALGITFLQGHENPDMRVQNNQGNALGGGQIVFEDGSFSNDTIDYRVRHVHGAATLLDTAAYASTGA